MSKFCMSLASAWLVCVTSFVAAETLELQSNEVPNGTITVSEDDADRSDWEGIEWYEFDDDFSDFSPVDIDRIQIAHDATHVYFHVEALAWDTEETWRVGTYIDADIDPLTGYTGDFLPLGADFLLEDTAAYRFTAASQVEWGWAEAGPTVRNQSPMTDFELSIPRATLGNPTEFDFILYANNTCCDFNMPDDIYPNGPALVFTYELGEAPNLPGDFDGNGLLDADDINPLSADVAAMLDTPLYDVTGDGSTNQADVAAWLELKNSINGDADLSGDVAFSDFLILSGQFGQAGMWTEGDFDSNGMVEFADFLILSGNFGSSGANAASVPEPSAFTICSLGLFASLYLRRRTRGCSLA